MVELIELSYILIPAGTVAFIYLIRKWREYQWGWVRNNCSLDGKLFIVTGANTGLGFETTKCLIDRGATVILACRDLSRADEAISKARRFSGNGQMIALQLDLSSFESIKSFAEIIKSEYPNFDCLINNAGLALKSKEFTRENFEIHFGVNYLGHFLLFNLLKKNVRQNESRVVVVSSKMHERGEIDFEHLGKYNDDATNNSRTNRLYNNSKLANFYFARELYKQGYDCHVLCPGLCNTDFFRDYNPRWYHYIMFSPIIWLMLRSAKQGAQNIVYSAIDNVNTEEKNPSTGYYVRNLVQAKSKVNFSEEVSTELWKESMKMCSGDLKMS